MLALLSLLIPLELDVCLLGIMSLLHSASKRRRGDRLGLLPLTLCLYQQGPHTYLTKRQCFSGSGRHGQRRASRARSMPDLSSTGKADFHLVLSPKQEHARYGLERDEISTWRRRGAATSVEAWEEWRYPPAPTYLPASAAESSWSSLFQRLSPPFWLWTTALVVAVSISAPMERRGRRRAVVRTRRRSRELLV